MLKDLYLKPPPPLTFLSIKNLPHLHLFFILKISLQYETIDLLFFFKLY